MKITLLGFTLPAGDMEEILMTDAYMPAQTDNFAWAMVEALQSAGATVTLLSSAPASSYPLNPRVRFRGGAFTDKGVTGERLGFINLVVLKHLTRFAACFTRGTRALRRWQPDVLLIHGVHSPFMLYGIVTRRVLGIPTVAILTDPPGVILRTDGRIERMLKKLDVVLVRRALRSFDGTIALTAPLVHDFAPRTPSIVMEGILADAAAPTLVESRGKDFRAVYAGSLLASQGVDYLVRAFQSAAPENWQLALLGKGELSGWIDQQARSDPRIERVPFGPRSAVFEQYASADLLVQPRPSDHDVARHLFPSKLLEYMASGTPVLSTRLPGIPATYEPYLYWIDDASVEGITRALRAVMSLPADERTAKGIAAARFVRESCSSVAQGARIRRFLTDLISE